MVIFFAVLFAVSLVALIGAYIGYGNQFGPDEPYTFLPLPPAESISIPRAIKEEIEQTPKWWDGEFHKLLLKSGEPTSTLVDETWEPDVITEKSANGSVCIQYVQSRPTYFESCMCGSCARNQNPNGWWQSDLPF